MLLLYLVDNLWKNNYGTVRQICTICFKVINENFLLENMRNLCGLFIVSVILFVDNNHLFRKSQGKISSRNG